MREIDSGKNLQYWSIPLNMSRGESEELVNQNVEDGQIDDVDEIGNEKDEADETSESKVVRSFCQQRKVNPIVPDALHHAACIPHLPCSYSKGQPQ